MNYFVRNVVLLHIVLLVMAFSWIHGGTRPDLLLPVIPWLCVFMVEFLLIFPQARSTETLADARRRVWHSLIRDPFLYLASMLAILLILPFFNVSGLPEYNPASHLWRNPLPPMPSMPFCVNPDEQAVLLLWFVPVMLAVLAAKHGLLKRGKRLLLEILCWNSAALAFFGFVQMATGAQSIFWGKAQFAYFFATFGYPNFGGAFFTLSFTLSAGLWFEQVFADQIGPSSVCFGTDDVSQTSRHWLLIPVLLNLVGAIATLCRAAILLCAIIVLVLGVYMIVGVWQKAESGGRVKLAAIVFVTVLMTGLFLTIFAPKALKTEIASITPATVMERVSGRHQYHARIAKAIFRDHPVFGVGGWGYPHYLLSYLTPEERKDMQIDGGVNVHNDTLQFLAEQGVTGYGVLVLCVLVLVVPLVWQTGKVCRVIAVSGTDAVPAKPVWLYHVPPVVIAVFVGTVATACHSLGDLPFRDPAVLATWFLSFVCATGFLPALRKN